MSKVTLHNTHKVLSLYEYEAKTGFPTGRIKDNVVGDIDYIPDATDSAACQIQTIYYNEAITRPFVKSNCNTGYMGSVVNYTLPARTLSANSQLDLDNQIAAHFAINGPAHANAFGHCQIVTYPHEWILDESTQSCELDNQQKNTGYVNIERLKKIALGNPDMLLDVNNAPIAISGGTNATKLNDPLDADYVRPFYNTKICRVSFEHEVLHVKKRKDSCAVEGEFDLVVYMKKDELPLLNKIPSYPRPAFSVESIPTIFLYSDENLATKVTFGWYYDVSTGMSYRVTDAGLIYDSALCALQTTRQRYTTSYVGLDASGSPQGLRTTRQDIWFEPSEYANQTVLLTSIPQSTDIFVYQDATHMIRASKGWYWLRKDLMTVNPPFVPETFFAPTSGMIRFIYVDDNGEITHYKDILN